MDSKGEKLRKKNKNKLPIKEFFEGKFIYIPGKPQFSSKKKEAK